MPSNIFGVNDNFDPENSHVLGALLRKIYLAKITDSKKVEIWGTGKPRREFLYVDDLADAILFLLRITTHLCLLMLEHQKISVLQN